MVLQKNYCGCVFDVPISNGLMSEEPPIQVVYQEGCKIHEIALITNQFRHPKFRRLLVKKAEPLSEKK